MIEVLKDIWSGALPLREIPGFLWYQDSDNRKRNHEQWKKFDWEDEWIKRIFPPSTSWDPIVDALIYPISGSAVLITILFLYGSFMFYKDQLFNFVIKTMVELSIRNGASFLQVYTALGAAILIFFWVLINFIFIFHKIFQAFDFRKDALPDGLAEIAYMIEHKSIEPISTNKSGSTSGIVS
jgi:hypothetical protein